MLTPVQLALIKAAILADPVFGDPNFPNNDDRNDEIAIAFNLAANPVFWVWRTDVSRADIYGNVDWEGQSWNWTTYKNQSVAEQNAWVQMFMGDQVNFSKTNLRAGVGAIFTGSAQANAQRDHCLSIGRRHATRAEKILADVSGGNVGTTAAPAIMVFEGRLDKQDVSSARNLP